jgi:hypothetical protein
MRVRPCVRVIGRTAGMIYPLVETAKCKLPVKGRKLESYVGTRIDQLVSLTR